MLGRVFAFVIRKLQPAGFRPCLAAGSGYFCNAVALRTASPL
jgi:hypothetical protein